MDVISPNDAYTDEDGAIYVQARPGEETHYIGSCYDMGDLNNPRSTKTPIWCLDRYRNHVRVGFTRGAPGEITTTVTGLTEENADWLERFSDDFCPFYLHITQSKCGSRGVWSHWERVWTILVESIEDDVLSGLSSREGGNPTTRAFNLKAFPPRVGSRRVTVSRETTTEVNAANDIWSCVKRCDDSCGLGRGTGEILYTGHDAAGAATANVLRAADYGVTWAATATDPFAADEDILAGVCVEVDRNTTRQITVREPDAANPLEIGYSDDAGATWTNVTVGATNNEGGTLAQCLFALDVEHIWLCTDQGEIYFSSDGGLTWTSQNATTASGGNALNAIVFIDYNIGYAVGAADTVVSTSDGGTNWAAATATGGGGALQTVQILDRYGLTVIVGDNAGDIYHSWDGATTWTNTWAGGNDCRCISFSTFTTGFMLHDAAGPVGTVYQTADGGETWHALTTPTNAGLNSVIALSPNLAFACGEPQGGTAVILEIGTPSVAW